VAGYELEYRAEAGSWTAWLTATTATTATFSALPQHQYYFRIRAIDRVGHLGAWVETGPVEIKAVTKYYHLGQQRVAMRQGGVVYYLHGDHLGSTTLTTDDTGAVVAQSRYLPYGQLRWTSGASPTDFGFTGQRDETSFGLMDYNARYYNPLSGRFISPDTVVPSFANPQTLNRHSYVNNNPLRYKDPSGHWIESALDIAGIAYDIYDIHQNGLNWENGLSLTADVAGLILPGVTGGGLAVRAVMHADDAIKLASRVDDVVDTVRAVENVADAATAANRATDTLSTFKKIGSEAIPDVIEAFGDSSKNFGYFTETAFGNRRITSLGRCDDTKVAGELGERILDIRAPDKWTPERNFEWLQEGIDNGDAFYLASPITEHNLFDIDRGINVYGRELNMLMEAGYKRQGDYLVPAELVK
jgi:RHS repeat-associated protein